MAKNRCSWVDEADAEYVAYHDNEWGVPVHNDRLLFEMLVLESFVAGLSWKCVLHKRQAFKLAFDNFEAPKVANYDDKKIAQLLKNVNIIRHRGKIATAVANAKIFLKIQQEFGSFDNYLWSWTNGQTVTSNGVETKSKLSDRVSENLKRKGMKFVGSITIFSYLCAVGIINAHQKTCFRHLI